eukprot:TRINITY_DN9339_c0_g1_i4.p1 TRINITY_DN9339_c0_g1~~TRINITY_DN9339_c0_g1_i4.p1  ORF type:complete len:316 (+),score=28.32 TRINITY_DN9339_c0_g1_i4:621-1568(+)
MSLIDCVFRGVHFNVTAKNVSIFRTEFWNFTSLYMNGGNYMISNSTFSGTRSSKSLFGHILKHQTYISVSNSLFIDNVCSNCSFPIYPYYFHAASFVGCTFQCNMAGQVVVPPVSMGLESSRALVCPIVCPLQKIHQSLYCVDCQSGEVPSPDQTGCLPCPTGTFSRRGDSNCTVCPHGRISNTSGSARCVHCSPGLYPVNTTTCAKCEENYFVNHTTWSCMMCPKDYYSSNGTHCDLSCENLWLKKQFCSIWTKKVILLVIGVSALSLILILFILLLVNYYCRNYSGMKRYTLLEVTDSETNQQSDWNEETESM